MSARRWATAGGLAALLAASAFVAATAPTSEDWQRPFLVPAVIGEHAAGRNIAVTVHGAHVADAVEDARWQSGDGSLWLVVDAAVAAVVEPSTLGHAELHVGERIFSASERPRARTLRSTALTPGIPVRGALAFELPADVLDDPGADTAELQLGAGIRLQLDSVLTTPVDLTALDRQPLTTIDEPVWGRG